MTCPSTRRIFAWLFLNHSEDKYDYIFQQLTENRSRNSKEECESHTNFSTSKKQLRL